MIYGKIGEIMHKIRYEKLEVPSKKRVFFEKYKVLCREYGFCIKGSGYEVDGEGITLLNNPRLADIDVNEHSYFKYIEEDTYWGEE